MSIYKDRNIVKVVILQTAHYLRVLKNHDKPSFDQNMNFYIHPNCRVNFTFITATTMASTITLITMNITATTTHPWILVMVTKSFLKLVIHLKKKIHRLQKKFERFLLLTGSAFATTNKFSLLLFSALKTICMQFLFFLNFFF